MFGGVKSSAQTEQMKVFRTTQRINGDLYQQTIDTLLVEKTIIDIYFFRQHFFSPNQLPEKFVNERYANQKISVWRDSNKKNDYHQNWENTYTYDSQGRVTSYTYSGCVVCSDFPYNYTVTYNSRGQVDQLFDSNAKKSFKFYYNVTGDMIKLEKYEVDKLWTVIESLN
jgi:hypothetical protein